ncbi:MAG: signal recognition particle receptor subunit beta [Cellvibrionaceae bacterium]|jgi:signal recognition particle receptor subunit beta
MFINWRQKELYFKIVYYGPPLSGKTTNLEVIHTRIPSTKRGKLVSVKTDEDRTLFFDFMEMELNDIQGLKPKFKLYTVPGQTYYASTRKLVMKDVDGLVFVADSSKNRMAINRHSFEEMKVQLAEMGYSLKDISLILQCNKQDLPGAVSAPVISRFLGISHLHTISAVATSGVGVMETLKKVIGDVVARH